MSTKFNILYNVDKNILEKITDKHIIDKIYYLENKVPTIDELKSYDKSKTLEEINRLVEEYNNKVLIEKIRTYISKLDYKIPLYDTYSENLYIISRASIYERVMRNMYRFPTKELLENIETKISNYMRDKSKDTDVLFRRKIRKLNLVIDFMKNFDIPILEETYYRAFYKYSEEVGKSLLHCERPSFNRYFYHIRPYYTRSEIINIALNMGVKIPDRYLDEEYVKGLCKIVRSNDVTADMLFKHQKYMLDTNSLGLIQYYTIQGSFFMNQYLRGLTRYDTKNEQLETLINDMWKLCLDTPAFDKKYTVYRFIKNDIFLEKIKIGDIYTENGFMSTTRDPFYRSDIYKFGFILVKINIPSGIKGVGLCVETLSHFANEQEIIFPPKSKFKLISRDDKCKYYHIDQDFGTKIKTKYEFDWVGNEGIVNIDRPIFDGKTKVVDFIKDKRIDSASVEEKIKYFISNYVDPMSRFISKIGNKEYVNFAERYDSTGAYKNFYAVNTENGFSIYSFYMGYMLYFIEIADMGEESEMHVNYYVKYNTLRKETILNDEEFLLYLSSIAYHFGVYKVVIYSEYRTCENNTYEQKNKFATKRQRSFSLKEDNQAAKTTEQEVVDNTIEVYTGNYCVDFYNYLKNGKKRFDNKKILSIEIAPRFSYYDLDSLKSIPINNVIYKHDPDEIFQVYEKVYLPDNPNKNNVADFFIWLIENKCYLVDFLTVKLFRVMNVDPFLKDMYILDPINFLYNRKIINTYSVPIDFNFSHKSRNMLSIQKNAYRLDDEQTKTRI